MIYGYARISRPQQSIERQVRNIKKEYPQALVLKEAYTGTKMDRPEWSKLYRKVKDGDVIVFDSVSRMSRAADDGVEIYFELYERGVELIFLKEKYVFCKTFLAKVAKYFWRILHLQIGEYPKDCVNLHADVR